MLLYHINPSDLSLNEIPLDNLWEDGPLWIVWYQRNSQFSNEVGLVPIEKMLIPNQNGFLSYLNIYLP